MGNRLGAQWQVVAGLLLSALALESGSQAADELGCEQLLGPAATRLAVLDGEVSALESQSAGMVVADAEGTVLGNLNGYKYYLNLNYVPGGPGTPSFKEFRFYNKALKMVLEPDQYGVVGTGGRRYPEPGCTGQAYAPFKGSRSSDVDGNLYVVSPESGVEEKAFKSLAVYDKLAGVWECKVSEITTAYYPYSKITPPFPLPLKTPLQLVHP